MSLRKYRGFEGEVMRVYLKHFSEEPLEGDPAWKVLQTPIKPERYIPPEELEEIMEEETWQQ